MAFLSPLMSYIVDKEVGFPIPSEKEKINKALRRYQQILSQHPKRSDAPEIMFGIADLLVGRGAKGDHQEAARLYDQILLKNPPAYLRARTLVGKAELMIGDPQRFDEAIALCEEARTILNKSLNEFFAAKIRVVEAELRLARRSKGDWEKALELLNSVINARAAHWYFRGRAMLAKAEILLYHDSTKLTPTIQLIDTGLRSLLTRPHDYFTNKGKILKAEILARRDRGNDLKKAEKLLNEVLSLSLDYQDLVARAKLDLADLVSRPKATKLIKEVHEMEGLDPYLVEKTALIEQTLQKKK